MSNGAALPQGVHAPDSAGLRLPPREAVVRTLDERPLRLAYMHFLLEGDTAEHHVRQFAGAARDLGHRVDVVAIRQKERPGPAAKSEIAPRGRARRVMSRYLREPRELLSGLACHRRAVRVVRRLQPDVLLVRHHATMATGFLTARRLGLPLVLEVNAPRSESRVFDREHARLPVLPEWLESKQLRSARRTVVVSRALRDHLTAEYGLDARRIVVAPNGADQNVFHPGIEADRELVSWCRQGTVVGFVGSFKKWHGVEMLAAAAEEVAGARPEARFLLVGDGPERDRIRHLSESLGGRSILTGSVPHARVPGLVAAFDIALLPETAFYCSPLKVLEWMAAGKAVVAPRYGPLEEIIEDGATGILFEPRNPAQLVESVLRLIDDEGLRSRLGAAAAASIAERLTWKHNAAKVLEACRSALVESSERPLPDRS